MYHAAFFSVQIPHFIYNKRTRGMLYIQ